MNRKAIAALLLPLALGACASVFQPVDVGVADDGFTIGGQHLVSREALVTALETRHAARVRLIPAPGVSPEQMAQARLAIDEAHSEALGVAGFEGP